MAFVMAPQRDMVDWMAQAPQLSPKLEDKDIVKVKEMLGKYSNASGLVNAISDKYDSWKAAKNDIKEKIMPALEKLDAKIGTNATNGLLNNEYLAKQFLENPEATIVKLAGTGRGDNPGYAAYADGIAKKNPKTMGKFQKETPEIFCAKMGDLIGEMEQKNSALGKWYRMEMESVFALFHKEPIAAKFASNKGERAQEVINTFKEALDLPNNRGIILLQSADRDEMTANFLMNNKDVMIAAVKAEGNAVLKRIEDDTATLNPAQIAKVVAATQAPAELKEYLENPAAFRNKRGI